MGGRNISLFSKPEVVVLKESSDAKDYLEKLETLPKEVVQGTDLANTIDREIAITKAGIAGECQVNEAKVVVGSSLMIKYNDLGLGVLTPKLILKKEKTSVNEKGGRLWITGNLTTYMLYGWTVGKRLYRR